MKKAVVSRGNASGIASGLIVFVLGIFLTATVVFAIVGVPLMICALFMGGRRQKVWKCTRCGYIFERTHTLPDFRKVLRALTK